MMRICRVLTTLYILVSVNAGGWMPANRLRSHARRKAHGLQAAAQTGVNPSGRITYRYTAFRFRGTEKNQYVAYPLWQYPPKLGTVRTLSFRFATNESTGMLMYMDDERKGYTLIEIFQGKLKLRDNNLGGSKYMVIDRRVDDGQWHTATLTRSFGYINFQVDNMQQSQNDLVVEYLQKSKTYFGGIPVDLTGRKLALPNVKYQTKFRGLLRNVSFNNVRQDPDSRGSVQKENFLMDSECLR